MAGNAGDVVILANERARGNARRFTTCRGFHGFPDGITAWWLENRNDTLAQMDQLAKSYRDTLFMVSVGPLSEVLIARLWRANPFNRYIDFGSAVDVAFKNSTNRGYADEQSRYYDQEDPPWTVDENNRPIMLEDFI